jgi:ABC-type proline/glycine betaine transport system permease subunit
MFKLVVLALLVAIIVSLGSGLVYLYKDQGQSRGLVKALTLRIGFSLALFLLLFLAWAMGWIQPHGVLPPG